MDALGIRAAWYYRCLKQETGLSKSALSKLEDMIQSKLPKQRRLSLDSTDAIEIPGSELDLKVFKKKGERVWLVEIRPRRSLENQGTKVGKS